MCFSRVSLWHVMFYLYDSSLTSSSHFDLLLRYNLRFHECFTFHKCYWLIMRNFKCTVLNHFAVAYTASISKSVCGGQTSLFCGGIDLLCFRTSRRHNVNRHTNMSAATHITAVRTSGRWNNSWGSYAGTFTQIQISVLIKQMKIHAHTNTSNTSLTLYCVFTIGWYYFYRKMKIQKEEFINEQIKWKYAQRYPDFLPESKDMQLMRFG